MRPQAWAPAVRCTELADNGLPPADKDSVAQTSAATWHVGHVSQKRNLPSGLERWDTAATFPALGQEEFILGFSFDFPYFVLGLLS